MPKILGLLNRQFYSEFPELIDLFDGIMGYPEPHELVKYARTQWPENNEGPTLILPKIIDPWLTMPKLRGFCLDFEGQREWTSDEVLSVRLLVEEYVEHALFPARLPSGVYRLKYDEGVTEPFAVPDFYPKVQNAARQHYNESKRAAQRNKRVIPSVSTAITVQGELARAPEGDEWGLLVPDNGAPSILADYDAFMLWERFDEGNRASQEAAVKRMREFSEQVRSA